MKFLAAALLLTALGLLAFMTWMLDRWLGIAAEQIYFLAFSLCVGVGFAALWRMSIRRGALPAGVLAFAVLASQLLLPPPSERLLRKAMLSVPLGAEVSAIEGAVEKAFEGRPYPLPDISRQYAGGDERVHVSLLSQRNGNCTAIVFWARAGLVVQRTYSPD